MFLKKILNNKTANLISTITFLFVSLLILFPIGSLHSSTPYEDTSEYLAEIAEKHTTSGQYTAMTVEAKNGSTKTIQDDYDEFHRLYGVFKERVATYIGAVNADRSHTVKISNLGDTNYSFLNANRGYDVKKYYIDEHGVQVYKTEFYPLELMFYSEHKGVPETKYFTYISQSRADMLLDLESKEHTTENYKNFILNKVITITIDDVETKYYIDNIYYERNYFYEAVHEVIGDFLFGGNYYPAGTVKRQALFFLRNYAFQNKFYMQYAASLYPTSDFDYKILSLNFKDGFQIDESRIVFDTNLLSDFVAISLVVLSVLLLMGALSLIYFEKFDINLVNTLLLTIPIIASYSIFAIIYLCTKNVFFFSSFATSCFIWLVLAFAVAYGIIFLLKRHTVKKGEKQ